MAEARLSVEIGANISELTSSLGRAKSQIKDFDSSAVFTNLEKSLRVAQGNAELFGNQLNADVAKIRAYKGAINDLLAGGFAPTSKEVLNLAGKIDVLDKKVLQSASGLSKVGGASGSAANALTNLGRVAQDAPFGFIGIQNNLNPLLESFGRLKQESGSTSGALKALGQSLIGPAGLGIALSVVSAGVLFYQEYQRKANKATEEAKKVNDDYIQSLNQVDQARVKGGQSATSELTQLRLLYNQTQNTTLSIQKRKDAVDDLQKQYPTYFGNLSDEALLAGKGASKYNELTQSILASARARAGADIITENTKKQLENEQKIVDLEKEQIKNSKVLKEEKDAAAKISIGIGRSGELKSIAASDRILFANKNIADTQKAINALKEENNKITEKNKSLEAEVNKQIEKGGSLTNDYKDKIQKVGKSISEIKFPSLFTEVKIEDQTAIEVLRDDIATTQDEATKNAKIFGKDYITAFNDGLLENAAVTEEIAAQTFDPLTNGKLMLAKEMADINSKIINDEKNFNEQLKEITSITGEDVSNFLGSLGEAFSSGDFSSFGANILKTFVSFLGNLGKLMMTQGIATIAFGKSLLINPLTAGLGLTNIASGKGMVAAGGILSIAAGAISGIGGSNNSSNSNNNSKQIPGFANGVTNFSGGMALVGERGPELVNLPKGSDVIPNHKMSDYRSAEINIGADLGIKLDTLYVALKKVENKRTRLGVS